MLQFLSLKFSRPFGRLPSVTDVLFDCSKSRVFKEPRCSRTSRFNSVILFAWRWWILPREVRSSSPLLPRQCKVSFCKLSKLLKLARFFILWTFRAWYFLHSLTKERQFYRASGMFSSERWLCFSWTEPEPISNYDPGDGHRVQGCRQTPTLWKSGLPSTGGLIRLRTERTAH